MICIIHHHSLPDLHLEAISIGLYSTLHQRTGISFHSPTSTPSSCEGNSSPPILSSDGRNLPIKKRRRMWNVAERELESRNLAEKTSTESKTTNYWINHNEIFIVTQAATSNRALIKERTYIDRNIFKSRKITDDNMDVGQQNDDEPQHNAYFNNRKQDVHWQTVYFADKQCQTISNAFIKI